ncbi:hypothetical protein SAMN05444287_0902 [Octadecabacter temperatus]|uniref:Uncharacterized protein n=1 Tax=Octadecabacter temperatus TaxID=1458307 RepID=A0A0K0Y493_9RHOB|nr:hypothetical protein [Octadecabacter temperatus]AKS45803.1 hypothetical protein OSB_12480 [Octadecabacter temperatus]SIO00881.1 hypothetical protein SAMN05444287_0902 [Octadecabacter temperatus]
MTSDIEHNAPFISDDNALTIELINIFRAATTTTRPARCGGFYISFVDFAAVLDGDEAVARRVLSASNFIPRDDGTWTFKRGGWPLQDTISFDCLTDSVDFHRPV